MIKSKETKIAGDFLYTLLATAVINVATQIIVFPLITRFYGDAVAGNILYFIGFIYIIPQALGTALNNSRLIVRKSCDATNADFTPAIAVLSGVSSTVGTVLALPKLMNFEDSGLNMDASFYGITDYLMLGCVIVSTEK